MPTGNVDPDAGVHVTGLLPSTRSDAVTVKVSAFPDGLEVVSVMFAGTLTDGPVVSVTRTVNDAGAALLPAASCALHVTVVSPTGNVDPDAGLHESTGLGSVSSLTVTV